MLSLTLILPALVASVDAFARARRRREPVSAWLLWIAAAAIPFVLGLGLGAPARGLRRDARHPGAPVSPALYPLDVAAVAVLAGIARCGGAGVVGTARLAVRVDPALADASAPGAAVACALVLSVW